MKAELQQVIEVGNTLGEGPVWDDRDGVLWWTDIQECRLYRLRPGSAMPDIFETPERLAAIGLTEQSGCVIAAFESGFARFEPYSGKTEWIAKVESDQPDTRLNDGRMDRQGRFWAGSMVEDEATRAGGGAGLYRLDPDGGVTRTLGGVQISNGLCWSPDSRTLYFADSPTRAIRQFAFDAKSGDSSGERMFATTHGSGVPDGADVDAAGQMWSAEWGGSRVTRYAPDGSITGTVELPVRQPTCIAFGGANMDLLFVTSAREGLSEADLAAQPLAGHLFIFQTDATGLPAGRFGAAA